MFSEYVRPPWGSVSCCAAPKKKKRSQFLSEISSRWRELLASGSRKEGTLSHRSLGLSRNGWRTALTSGLGVDDVVVWLQLVYVLLQGFTLREVPPPWLLLLLLVLV